MIPSMLKKSFYPHPLPAAPTYGTYLMLSCLSAMTQCFPDSFCLEVEEKSVLLLQRK